MNESLPLTKNYEVITESGGQRYGITYCPWCVCSVMTGVTREWIPSAGQFCHLCTARTMVFGDGAIWVRPRGLLAMAECIAEHEGGEGV